LKNFCVAAGSSAVFLTLASLGCGYNTFNLPPVSAIAATSNPLVAQYSIRHVQPGFTAWVEFGTDTNYGRQTSVMQDSSTIHGVHTMTILVAGMLPQTTYHMRAHVNWTGGSWVDQDQTFKTGAIPNSLPLPQVSASTVSTFAAASPMAGVELLSLVPANPAGLSAAVTDLSGNIIWFCPGTALPIKPLNNGHFIVVAFSDLLEIDLACNTIRDVSLQQMNQSLQAHGYSFPPLNVFHHDVLVLPNGHWIALAQITKNFNDLPGFPGTTGVLGDVLLDIDPAGNVVWAWSAFDYLDVNRHLYGLPDWTHSNALVYTPDGNLLLSIRHQSWILKIDYANGTGTGNVLWKLGGEGDFTLLGGDPSQWFSAQHYPIIFGTDGAQMTLGIWDNGNLRTDSTGVVCGSTPTAPACYSRATIFQIDESTNLASVLWEDLPGFYSFWGGSIVQLSNGDVEFDMTDPADTDSSQIMEVTQSPNPQVVWQMNIGGANAYRGYRIPSLYPGVTWQQ
jgi:arylsulfate sulfotransferase